MNNIPKTINYCWFGKKEKNELIKKCINSWKKFLPDYEIIEWNEENFDVNQNFFVKEAYENQKYAFVSDFARLKVIYENGGIYFDVDIELIKDLKPIIDNGPYVGCENEGLVNTGVGFAAEPKNLIIKKMLDKYENIHFINDGEMDLTTCTQRNTEAILECGWNSKNVISKVQDKITVYPTEYFCPYDYITGKQEIRDNTYSIHHCNASWLEDYERMLMNHKKILVKKFKKIGTKLYYIEKIIVLLFKDKEKLLNIIKKRK